jgi:tetratricopeptide (TPR) repeat protein
VADFVRDVAERYTVAALHRLAQHGERTVRRSAVLALTLIGHAESVAIVGEALRDVDRAVRLLAEDGIRAMWQRVGTVEQNRRLQILRRLVAARQWREARELAHQLLAEHPEFAAVWHQRAAIHSANQLWRKAIADHQRALECDPYFFPAALQMAQCYLEMGDLSAAVSCLQWTLQIHPHLDVARSQLLRLQRVLREREQTDR